MVVGSSGGCGCCRAKDGQWRHGRLEMGGAARRKVERVLIARQAGRAVVMESRYGKASECPRLRKVR